MLLWFLKYSLAVKVLYRLLAFGFLKTPSVHLSQFTLTSDLGSLWAQPLSCVDEPVWCVFVCVCVAVCVRNEEISILGLRSRIHFLFLCLLWFFFSHELFNINCVPSAIFLKTFKKHFFIAFLKHVSYLKNKFLINNVFQNMTSQHYKKNNTQYYKLL